MSKYLAILTILLSLFQTSGAQHYQLVSLSKQERKDANLMSHYEFTSATKHPVFRIDEFSGADLYFYKNGKFVYRTYTDLEKRFSTGKWIQKGDIIELRSEIGKNALPVEITYLNDHPVGAEFKKFAFVKDLNDSDYIKAAIHVNVDSVACFGGDMECFGTYTSIDSVRVAITDDIYSPWLKVDAARGIIQLTLQTKIDLYQYFPMQLRLRKTRNGLIPLKD